MKDRILVTGGAGYIGAHACKILASQGLLPVTYDNFSTGHKSSVKWGPLVEGDIRDRKQLDFAIKQYEPKGVLHFAAMALVTESIESPSKYYDNNVLGSITLLNAMLDAGIKNLVFSSTCATYGHPQSSIITEEHPQNPISPYGRSKLMVEQIIHDFGRAYDLKAVNLRYFNAAGADSQGEIGENHTPETHLIPSVIETALGVRKELVVYGDGTTVRDYIHVEDLGLAHFLALKWLFANQRSESFNLGTGTGSSILEIIKTVQTFSKKEIPIRMEKKREGDPDCLVASNEKAKRLLGWTPVVSSLPTLIESAWKWHNKSW